MTAVVVEAVHVVEVTGVLLVVVEGAEGAPAPEGEGGRMVGLRPSAVSREGKRAAKPWLFLGEELEAAVDDW